MTCSVVEKSLKYGTVKWSDSKNAFIALFDNDAK